MHQSKTNDAIERINKCEHSTKVRLIVPVFSGFIVVQYDAGFVFQKKSGTFKTSILLQ